MKKAATEQEQIEEISILRVERGYATFHLLGTTPLIYHRMGEKAKRVLLLPGGRKTEAEKAATLKHNPLEEYRSSVYRAKKDIAGETALVFPGGAFHKATSDAALDLPGVNKSKIGRLTGVQEFDVNIYGIPAMYMHEVRNSDINHTPDIRTRAILERWACRITVWFSRPLLRQTAIIDLMAAAGIYIGIGDWRQQKGSRQHGLWNIVDADDKEFLSLVKHCGRAAQLEALENPSMYDDETAALYAWYTEEAARRRDQPPAPAKKKRKPDAIDQANGGDDAQIEA